MKPIPLAAPRKLAPSPNTPAQTSQDDSGKRFEIQHLSVRDHNGVPPEESTSRPGPIPKRVLLLRNSQPPRFDLFERLPSETQKELWRRYRETF